jgi:hypothetical protein
MQRFFKLVLNGLPLQCGTTAERRRSLGGHFDGDKTGNR